MQTNIMKTPKDTWERYQDQVTLLARGIEAYTRQVSVMHDRLLKTDSDFYKSTIECLFLREFFAETSLRDVFLIKTYRKQVSSRPLNKVW
jgi:hypothetical protein